MAEAHSVGSRWWLYQPIREVRGKKSFLIGESSESVSKRIRGVGYPQVRDHGYLPSHTSSSCCDIIPPNGDQWAIVWIFHDGVILVNSSLCPRELDLKRLRPRLRAASRSSIMLTSDLPTLIQFPHFIHDKQRVSFKTSLSSPPNVLFRPPMHLKRFWRVPNLTTHSPSETLEDVIMVSVSLDEAGTVWCRALRKNSRSAYEARVVRARAARGRRLGWVA